MTNKLLHALLSLTFSTVFCSASLAEAVDPVPLSAEEVRTLLTNNSLAGNGKIKTPEKPYDWIAYYASDGTVTLRLKPSWGGLVMTGRWWFNDQGHHCRKFETGHKKAGCWRFQREGQFIRFVPTSGVAVEGRAIVLKGNALD